jgi:hypothetical protein
MNYKLMFFVLMGLTSFSFQNTQDISSDRYEASSKIDLLVGQNWRIKETVAYGVVIYNDTLEKNLRYLFNNNGTYEIKEGEYIGHGIWEFRENESQILLDKNTQWQNLWTIKHLDQNRFNYTIPIDSLFSLEYRLVPE